MTVVRRPWSVVKVVGFFALSALLLALSFPVEAQQAKKAPRIGFLCAMSGPSHHTEGFLLGLRERGYVDGQNIKIEYRFTEGKTDPFRELAAELVRLKLDVIVVASAPAIQPTMEATKTIPIVMAQSDDPVQSGSVKSLARPGGNVTGLSSMAPELSAKQLELLKEAFPKIARVALLRNASGSAASLQDMEKTARSLGVRLQSLEVGGPKDLDPAFVAMRKNRLGAVVIPQELIFFDYQEQLVDLSTKHKLPAIYAWSAFAEVGGLMAYGPSDRDLFRRAALYVDKILKGAKPADLPVEQPMKFELVINLKAAKQIGVTIPPNLLTRADRVIR